MQKYLHIFKTRVKILHEGEPPVFHHGRKARLKLQAVKIKRPRKNEIHTKFK